MRILFARNLYRPIDFGGNRYPYEVTKRLAARGHAIRVVTGDFTGPPPQGAPPIVRYPVSRTHPGLTFGTNALFGGATTAIERSRFHPDVVVLSSYDLAYGYQKFGDGPIVFIYHSSFHSEWTRRLAAGPGARGAFGRTIARFARHVEHVVLGRARLIIAVSPFSAREIATLGASPAEGCRVIPTGVDTTLFSPGSRTDARRELGLPQEDLVLVTVGRLARVKRYDRAIAATAELLRRGLSVRLLVVGDGPERASLERLTAEHGITDKVRFEGHRDGQKLVVCFRAADIQLCTSEFENWSLALLEGLACSVPALGTPFGGTPEMLREVDPRLVLVSGEPRDVADGVERLGATDRATLAPRCRAYAERFNWDAAVSRVEEALQEVARAGPSSR